MVSQKSGLQLEEIAFLEGSIMWNIIGICLLWVLAQPVVAQVHVFCLKNSNVRHKGLAVRSGDADHGSADHQVGTMESNSATLPMVTEAFRF